MGRPSPGHPAGRRHTSTSDDALWDSGQLAPQPLAHTFTTPGTYACHCTFHPQAMRGTITVVAPSYLPIALNPDTAAQPSPTATVRPSATATMRPSPTATTGPPAVRGIRGNVQVRPRWAVVESQPTEYTIILDVGGSMSWNFAGQAKRNGQTIQCGPTNSFCGGYAWEPREERRIYFVKQALKGMIDALPPDESCESSGSQAVWPRISITNARSIF